MKKRKWLLHAFPEWALTIGATPMLVFNNDFLNHYSWSPKCIASMVSLSAFSVVCETCGLIWETSLTYDEWEKLNEKEKQSSNRIQNIVNKI
jgi:hypothetical protein